MSSDPSSSRRRQVPFGRAVTGRVRPPSSKSVTHRYLNLSLLAGGGTVLEHPLDSEDIRHFLDALEVMGFALGGRGSEEVRIGPRQSDPREARLHCGNAGTMYRFLVASLATQPGRFVLDGTPRLRQRPIAALVRALRHLGAVVEYLEKEGSAPLAVNGGSLEGGSTVLDAGESSQYLSALLMAATRARRPVEIRVDALTSTPYVDLTVDAMRLFGSAAERQPGGYRVTPSGLAPPPRLVVEGDYSAAAYPAAAAALTGGDVLLEGLRLDSAQGDRRFLGLLEEMGARVESAGNGVRVRGTGRLRALEADLSSMPDQVPTLAALAPFCVGTTTITGVPHLRLKESDRLRAMAVELAKLGVEVREEADGLVIQGTFAGIAPPVDEVVVETYDDHRIAMSLALVGLRRPGVVVADPGVVAKSYPAFWRDLDDLVEG